MNWKVRVRPIDGQEKGEIHTFEGESVAIGRALDNDLVIPHPCVSRYHLILARSAGGILVEDQGSTHGTALAVPGSEMKVASPLVVQPPFTLKLAGEMMVEVFAGPKLRLRDSRYSESVVVDIAPLGFPASLMVLDLCDSTFTACENEVAAYHLKTRLASISREVLQSVPPRALKDTGDGFLAVFSDPRAPAEASFEILHRVEARNLRSTHPPIKLRVALHHGRVFRIGERGDDVHGRDVNLVFRLEGVQESAFTAQPPCFPATNRVLCTQAFWRELAQRETGRFSAASCGFARLEGFNQPEEVLLLTPA